MNEFDGMERENENSATDDNSLANLNVGEKGIDYQDKDKDKDWEWIRNMKFFGSPASV